MRDQGQTTGGRRALKRWVVIGQPLAEKRVFDLRYKETQQTTESKTARQIKVSRDIPETGIS